MRLPAVLLAFPVFLNAAETFIPSVIGDHMLLQRETSAPVWGWDEPGATVSVTFRGATVQAQAGKDGRFEARVPTGAAGGPFTLDIAGSSKHQIQDVLVGEVWIAGGQSNMWWQLRNATGGKEAIAAADLPQLRWFDANTSEKESGWPADTPQRTVKGAWVASSPAQAGDFASPAFFFARELQQELKIPVGIVNTSVPGTAIELWLRPAIIASQFPDAAELHRLRQMTYVERHKTWEDEKKTWDAEAAKAKAEGRKEPAGKPEEPKDPKWTMGALWNGTVAPVVPYAARGFLWWQGEYNAGRFTDYRVRFPALIEDWRHQWGLENAPWFFVELAGFGGRYGSQMEDASWPALRDAQKSALAQPHVHRISAIDILDEAKWEIHPPNKAQTGHRFFLATMAKVYGKADTVWSGPDMTQVAFSGANCRVELRDAQGLRVRGGGAVKGFVLAGRDRVWQPAEARIDGAAVVVTCAAVPEPVAVRYAWMNNPDSNLENAAGLPAWPFRSDDWPLCHKE